MYIRPRKLCCFLVIIWYALSPRAAHAQLQLGGGRGGEERERERLYQDTNDNNGPDARCQCPCQCPCQSSCANCSTVLPALLRAPLAVGTASKIQLTIWRATS